MLPKMIRRHLICRLLEDPSPSLELANAILIAGERAATLEVFGGVGASRRYMNEPWFGEKMELDAGVGETIRRGLHDRTNRIFAISFIGEQGKILARTTAH